MKVYVVYRETCCQNGFIDKGLVAIFSKEEYAIAYCERQAVGLDVYWYDIEYVDSEVEE